MDKVEVLKHLTKDEFPYGIAEVICDIACGGQVCYPNESVLVIVYDKDEYYVADDLIDNQKHWTICESIDDFIDGIVYGRADADKHYCKHYVETFKVVKPFESDYPLV